MRFGQARVLGLLVGFLSLPALAAESRRFELSVVVDGAPIREYPWQGRTYVEALRGRPFSLRITNPTSERVAVAVSVDGRNVVDAKRTSERQATKWVLDPWQSIEIPGWQVSGHMARRFFFTETARSYAKWLGDTSNVGTIEAVFFREKPRAWPIPLENPRLKRPDAPRKDLEEKPEEGAASRARDGRSQDQSAVRGEAPSVGAQRAPEAAGGTAPFSPDNRGGVRPSDAERVADSYAATGIGERTHFPVHWVRFDEDPAPVARVALRYEFARELARLGVLRRDFDDLEAREHARGFAPEYAPDPDRHR